MFHWLSLKQHLTAHRQRTAGLGVLLILAAFAVLFLVATWGVLVRNTRSSLR